jgi:hypothetical protein
LVTDLREILYLIMIEVHHVTQISNIIMEWDTNSSLSCLGRSIIHRSSIGASSSGKHRSLVRGELIKMDHLPQYVLRSVCIRYTAHGMHFYALKRTYSPRTLPKFTSASRLNMLDISKVIRYSPLASAPCIWAILSGH